MAIGKDGAALNQLLLAWGRGDWSVRPPALGAELLALLDQAVAQARAEERAVMVAGIDQATDALVQLVIQGDLRLTELDPKGNDVLLPLFAAVNQSGVLLRSFVRTMADAVRDITAGTVLVNEQLAATERNLEDQAITSQELAATLSELRATSEEIERSTGSVAQMAGTSLSSTEKGSVAAQHFSSLMQGVRLSAGSVNAASEALSSAVQQVGAVTDLITEVADRSDVLALNAALEAARAGEAGSGFGIVADEMRRMSARVLASTAQVQALVEKIREATAQVRLEANANVDTAMRGDKQAHATLVELGLIGTAVKDTNDAAHAIRSATEQQRAATTQAAEAINALSQEATATAAASRQVRQSAGHLSALGTRLTDLVKRFQVPDDA